MFSTSTDGLAAPILSTLEDVIGFGLVALAILAPLVVAAGFILFAVVTGRFLRKRVPKNTQSSAPALTA